MIELDLVLGWLAGIVGLADCAICQLYRDAFDHAMGLGIGALGAGAAAAGTAAGRVVSDPIGAASDFVSEGVSDMSHVAGTVAGTTAGAATEAVSDMTFVAETVAGAGVGAATEAVSDMTFVAETVAGAAADLAGDAAESFNQGYQDASGGLSYFGSGEAQK